MIIPIRTDTPVRRPPLANYLLLAANVLLYLVCEMGGTAAAPIIGRLSLNAGMPDWWQFFSYQFLHGDPWHLAGNMLFLWVFGNSVNAKFGDLPYLLFYLSAGVFAGWGFCMLSDATLIGASGSIAGITTAFMVLFPKSRILFLFLMFLITTFELPSVWVILFKIVIWDNVLGPAIAGGDTQVAHSAHLYGYVYGFVATLAMLLFGALSRDHFDLPAMIKRWNQRRTFSSMMSDPAVQASAQYGTVARPITLSPQKQKEMEARLDQASTLRAEIHGALGRQGGAAAAVEGYEQLMVLDPAQCLSRPDQLEVGKALYAHNKLPQAAAAFEKYLRQYPKAPAVDEVRLLVGIIYARDLAQYEAAEGHLRQVAAQLSDPDRQQQCRYWLDQVTAALRPTRHDAG